MTPNLFLIFDSNTNNFIFELNWISSMFILLFFPNLFWLNNSRYTMMFLYIMNKLLSEFKIILMNKFNQMNLIFFMSFFFFILMNNFLGMFPYIFNSSSHLIFSLNLALPFWISLMFFMLTKNLNLFFTHLIPQNTPFILMPFMVIIETISNLIRPLTLSIRLTANMIAGHLLLALLSDSTKLNLIMSWLIIFIQIILLILEFSVSIIQSYVFSILSVLYSKELN